MPAADRTGGLPRMPDWDTASQRVSEGHCGLCASRLRTLTDAEQIIANGWHAEPFAVCPKCALVHCRPRPGQNGYPMVLGGVVWDNDGDALVIPVAERVARNRAGNGSS